MSIVNYAQLDIGPQTQVAANTESDWYRQFRLPGKWLIKSVRWVPHDAITADPTNYCVFTLTNATASTTIGARSYAATNSVAGTPESVTLPTGLAAVIAQGDVLKLAKTDPGTGLAARGEFSLELERLPLP
jgi:hypothetical protein